jgi:hypothetical protein
MIKGNINKLLTELDKKNAEGLSKQENLDDILGSFNKFYPTDMRKFDCITIFSYGKLESHLENGVIVYKKGEHVLHVTKTRANKKHNLSASNSVKVYGKDMEYILG